MTLTKAHIINAIADQIGYPKNHASELVETLLEIVKKALESDNDVMISGFGKFVVRQKGARRGRNPQTTADLYLKERRVVVFKASGVLRDKINRKSTSSL